MFGMFLGIIMMIAMVCGIIWVCDQISSYLHCENLKDEDYFEFEPIFK